MTRSQLDPLTTGPELRPPARRWILRLLRAAAVLVVGAGWTIGGAVLLFQILWESGSNGTFRYHLASVVVFVPVVGTLVAVAAAVAPSRWQRALWIAAGVLVVTWGACVLFISVSVANAA